MAKGSPNYIDYILTNYSLTIIINRACNNGITETGMTGI